MLKHLQPLQISEEMLGAYLEGNLSSEEVSCVEAALQTDMNLQELLEDVGKISADGIPQGIYDSYVEYPNEALLDFELPEINNHWTDDGWNDATEEELTEFGSIYDDTETTSLYADVQETGFDDETFEL